VNSLSFIVTFTFRPGKLDHSTELSHCFCSTGLLQHALSAYIVHVIGFMA